MDADDIRRKIELGERIRKRRVLLNMTQKQLSEKLNVSKNFLGDVERGKKNMSSQTLFKTSRILSVPVDFLLDGSVPPYAYTPSENTAEGDLGKNKLKFFELLQHLGEDELKHLNQIIIPFIFSFKKDL